MLRSSESVQVKFHLSLLIAVMALGLLSACGGGGGGSAPVAPVAPPAPTLNLNFALKQLQFSWTAVSDAMTYRLFENPDGVSGYTQVGADMPATATTKTLDIAVHRHNWPNARYLLEACNAVGCTASNEVFTLSGMLQTIGYFKASNTEAGDHFSRWTIALSADGNTLAVGAPLEASAATGINGNQADNSAPMAGAVYVFTRTGGTWITQTYIKASNTETLDQFGSDIALSGDGNTLAVGAPGEDSAATGINGNQGDNSASFAGAVYVYTRTGGTWTQQAYVKASNTEPNDDFGNGVALSGDGNTLAVGAIQEASAAIGINGNEADNSAPNSGALYVFTRSAGTWSQEAYVKASNTGAGDRFGARNPALSADGNTLAVAAFWENSAATGINGDQGDNSAPGAGAVYLFTRTGGTWAQQAYVKASNTGSQDRFGGSLALSADGNTLAVGAWEEDSAATGINGNQGDNSAIRAGATYVFARIGDTWTQQAYVKSSNTESLEDFGFSNALSANGDMLAVGARIEDSAATGIGGDQFDNSATNSGAVYVFTRNAGTWSQQAYVKASNTESGDDFGTSVALSADGNTLAVGADGEASLATGINGDQGDNSAPGAGAVYLY